MQDTYIQDDIAYQKILIKEFDFEIGELKLDLISVSNNIVKRFIEDRIKETEQKRDYKEFEIWKLENKYVDN